MVDQETIVLMTPIAGNDYPTGRDPITLEQLRNGYAQAAHDFQAVFIDWYGFMPDNDFSVQACMMDAPYGTSGVPVQHIHPGDCKSPLYEKVLSDALLEPLKTLNGGNTMHLSTGTMGTPIANTNPSGYQYGWSVFRVVDATWPYNGMVATLTHTDGADAMQINCPYAASSSGCAFRLAASSSMWSPWVVLGELTNPNVLPTQTVASAPSAYAPGLSLLRAADVSWPYNGQSITFSQGSGGNDVLQINAPAAGSSQMAWRVSTSSSTWSQWNTMSRWTQISRGATGTWNSLTLITTPATAVYQIRGAINCDSAKAAATVTLSFSYTDTLSTAQTIPAVTATCTTLGSASIASINQVVQAETGTLITVTTTVSGGPTYDVSASLDQITIN